MTHGPAERGHEVTGPSNRSFGTLFTVVFVVVAFAPLRRGAAPRLWAVLVSALFLAATLAAPALLAPLNRIWLRIGLAMHRVVNPIVMGVLFYGAVTPFGALMRLFGKGLAPRLRPDESAGSYWVPRTRADRSRMDQQF